MKKQIMNMNGDRVIISVGIIMVISGLISFYSIQSSSELDYSLKLVKHGGTFVGLMGIGVTMAGVLLDLINRNKSPIEENYDAGMK